jgi:serine/threonine protein kinase
LITKTESIVARDTFRQALIRARQDAASSDAGVQCGGDCYRLMHRVGSGEISQVYTARRAGTLPFLATIKISSAPSAAERYSREARALRELQASDGGSVGAYFSQRLPEVVTQGPVEGAIGQQALVLRHPTGFWGSLESLNERYPQGIDPRHAVWIWRRILDVLSFVHRQGWSHGDVRPEHALVHPRDHGIRLIGWESAQAGATRKNQGADLSRSARVIVVLLCGANGTGVVPDLVPTGLAQLVARAGQDEAFCCDQGAQGLDALLKSEAKAAFGPPSFVPLTV